MSDRMKSSNLYFPEFGGSTGGWLEAAETEENHRVMTEVESDTVGSE